MQPSELIPERFRDGAQRMAAALRGVDRVIVAAHVNPDGDAVGAMAAAGHILRALGREFVLYVTPRVPQDLSFLPLPGTAHTTLERLPFTPRWALLLDCGEPRRLGQELADRLPELESLNIDHHLGGDGMGSAGNWVEPQAAATAQLMAYVALAAGLPLEGGLATAVTLGLVTDTGGFRHGNTGADVLRLAAHLVEKGCDLAGLREKLDSNWSQARMHLWGELMRRAELRRGGTVAFCPVRLDDLRATGALKEDLEGFVEQLRQLRGVRAAALLREDAPGCCKFSLRSCGTVDVRAAAAALDGGGHRNAAGGTLRMGMPEAEETLLNALARELDSEGL